MKDIARSDLDVSDISDRHKIICEPADLFRAPTLRKPRRSVTALRMTAAAVLLAALAGCARTHVDSVTSTTATAAAPSEILVDVTVAPMADSDDAKAAQDVGAQLRAGLVQRLTEARVIAEPFVPGTSHPGSAVLHVSVVEADPGSLVERFIIGFGAGRARLQAKADLESSDTPAAYSLTAFNTSSDSGYKPGLILPGGIALATRNVIHLAIGGGIDVALNISDGLDRQTSGAASAIVDQLKKYYASVGWHWPSNEKA